MQRTKNGLAVFNATIRLWSECWNWAPTVCAFLTFLWTTRRLSLRIDWWLPADEIVTVVVPEVDTVNFSCEEETLEGGATDEFSEELLWPNRPASVLTVSKLRQFLEGRLRALDTLFLRALSLPFPFPVKLSWPDVFNSTKRRKNSQERDHQSMELNRIKVITHHDVVCRNR